MSDDLAVTVDVTSVPDRPMGAGRYIVELTAALARGSKTDLGLELTLVTRRRDGSRWVRIGGPDVRVVAAGPDARPVRLAWEQTALPRLVGQLGAAVHHGPHYTMP